MTYKKIIFQKTNSTLNEILIAMLSNIKYEGFEEKENELFAFIPESNFEESEIKEIATSQNIQYIVETIAHQNWNALWESNYEPVIVENIVVVRANFHEPVPNVKHQILITPKMSFGTGHHATTWLMLKEMSTISFENKSVFDYGTGTGILAIFAHILGAGQIVANDIEDWTVENCRENFVINKVTNAEVILGDLSAIEQNEFDIILANINYNILVDSCSQLFEKLKSKGHILISGIMLEDMERINKVFENQGFSKISAYNKNNWATIHYIKP